MKKIATLLLSVLLLLTYNTEKVAAGAAAGGATEVTQLLNNLELIPINISDALTAAATQAQNIFTTIWGPIANAIIANMLESTTKNIISWANGGLSGDSPQLLQNPEDFVRKAANNEARKALSAIPLTGESSGAAFDTIRNNILFQNKDLQTKVKESLSSQLPATVQSNVCKDSRLTELANERATGRDGVFDQSIALVEKEYLYGYFCSCDPNTETDCAIKLMDAYTQRPELGGGEAWLRLTGGDNMFTKVTNTNALVAEELALAKKRAEDELYLGLGAVSETKCLDLQEDAAGNTYCNKSIVVNPGKAVQSAIETAVNAGTLRLTNIQGEGTLSSILGALTRDFFSKGLSLGVSSLSGGGSSGGNTSVTVTSVAPATNDLGGDAAGRDRILRTISSYFGVLRSTLSDLESLGVEFRNYVVTYRGTVTRVKTCYDSLIARNLTKSTDPRAINAYNYYNDRINKISTLEAVISDDSVKIAAARDFINSNETQIQSTQSSQTINTLFSSFRDGYKANSFPDTNSYITRRQTLTEAKNSADRDNEGTTHINTCNQIEQSYNYSGGNY